MSMPSNVKAICDAYVGAVGVPVQGPSEDSEAFENRCRAWTRGLAQQIVFSTGDESWGTKKSASGHPQSKDAIAHQIGPRLYGYDMMVGVGTGHPSYNNNPSEMDISGQVFIEVEPFDHIGGGGSGGGGGEGGTDDNDEEVAELQAQVRELQQDVARLTAAVAALEGDAVRYGEKLGLRAWGEPERGREGMVLCAESGGPDVEQRQFVLTSRRGVGPWETWTVERGT